VWIVGSIAEQEVIDFHVAAQDWLSGRAGRETGALDRITRQLGAGFTTVMPDGVVVARDDLVAVLNDGFGTRGGNFEIRVNNLRLLVETPALSVVMFEEWQRFGNGKVTARQSTAALSPRPGNRNNLEWLLIHETWLPAEQLKHSIFDAA
jgi:hypothetical protein